MAMGVRLMGGDGWRLADDAMSLGYGGLDDEQVKDLLRKQNIDPEKFLADNDFWKKLEEADAKIK